MADGEFSDDQLLAYLDEQLPVEQMTVLEKSLRDSDTLRLRAASLARRRDQGVHSVGEIWRRHRLSCPARKQLGSYLLEALNRDQADYVRFHVETIGCRFCAANLRDLEQEMQAAPETQRRRQKFFQSSAGYLDQISDDHG